MLIRSIPAEGAPQAAHAGEVERGDAAVHPAGDQDVGTGVDSGLLPWVRRRAMNDLVTLVARRTAIIRIDAAFRLSVRTAAA